MIAVIPRTIQLLLDKSIWIIGRHLVHSYNNLFDSVLLVQSPKQTIIANVEDGGMDGWKKKTRKERFPTLKHLVEWVHRAQLARVATSDGV